MRVVCALCVVRLLTYNATQAESRNRLIELSANLVGKRLEVQL